MQKIKYLTKELLDKVNKRAIANNYNRAVTQEFVDALPDDLKFPIVFQMIHEHAAGQPVAPHMRCRIMTGKALFGPFEDVFIDVEMGMYEMLPEKEIPDPPRPKKKSTKAKSGVPKFYST